MISGMLGEIDDRWSEIFQASGQTYTRAAASCCSATPPMAAAAAWRSAAMGPFYCPPDQQIFLDTGFFREVETALPRLLGQRLQVHRGLHHRPRSRPSHPEPARHPAAA